MERTVSAPGVVRMMHSYRRTQLMNETPEIDEDYNFLTYLNVMNKYIMNKRRQLAEVPTIEETPHSKKRRNLLDMKVRLAQEDGLVFMLLGYYPAVRLELCRFGWVEKLDKLRTKYDVPLKKEFSIAHIPYLDSAPLILKNETPAQYNQEMQERKYMSDLLEDIQPDLVFSLRRSYIAWNALKDDTLVSYFPKCSFCNKLGLNLCLENMVSFKCNNDSLKYPRGYNLHSDNVVRRFTQDFRESTCLSLMTFVTHCYDRHRVFSSLDGIIPFSVFDMAEEVCLQQLARLQLERVGESPRDRYRAEEGEEETDRWLQFGRHVFNLTNMRYSFVHVDDTELVQVYVRARKIVQDMDEYNKKGIFDGMYNVWVVKPVANCSGHGIRLYRQMDDILKTIYPLRNGNYTRSVVQKYIEKPLLIYGVKFDLRVWYLVTNIRDLKIWVYHEGYVRFCSRPYSLILLDEARHLTNVRVQRHYRNKREPAQLPPELMWDFRQLKTYFTEQMNLPRTWGNILGAMEQSILTIMQCAVAYNSIDLRHNSFQLFGADFLIHENFQPCLIEVNNGPGLSPTTSIIAKKTTSLLRDMVKVLQHERGLPHGGETGDFHLIYTKDLTPPAMDTRSIMQAVTAKPVVLPDWKRCVKARRLAEKTKKIQTQ